MYKEGTSRQGGQAPAPPTRLFQVRRNLCTITRICEVSPEYELGQKLVTLMHLCAVSLLRGLTG